MTLGYQTAVKIHPDVFPVAAMVSVADEQGRLVLMGVDATYCVVDEVDTTASTMHDQFLQQVTEEQAESLTRMLYPFSAVMFSF